MSRTKNLTIRLSKAPSVAASVAYSLQAVTASEGEFTAASGTANFAAGQMTAIVPITVTDEAIEGGTFRLVLSEPVVNCTYDNSGGLVTIGVGVSGYHAIFNQVYAAVHDPANKYFGPQSGPRARSVPLHISALDSIIINEAPDHGGQSVSETVSYWPGLEAWNGMLNEDWTGYNRAWTMIDTYYVPTGANQPIVTYDPEAPASYIAEQVLPSLYPPATQVGAAVGVDPLATELATVYGSTRVYLMQWIFDIEGYYGFHNGDGTTDIVAINTYERGMQESSFETIAHPCWGDWTSGSTYGFEPLYTQGKPVYPAAPLDYGKKWSYTNAPDAEVRAIGWAAWAKKWATDQGNASVIAASSAKASKMGDYTRYNLFDKYFREIGNNTVGASFANSGSYKSCHYLINWYAAFGGEVPPTGQTQGSWGYRIGCSECHQGYQGINAAYALSTGQGNLVPAAPSTGGDIWVGSVYRQAEMIRWLQSPEGPIAGGVTNSIDASYQPATGGRQNATFYGMHYVYSPVWHDPQSNNWVGFQAWGQGRTADLFLEISEKAVGSRTAMDTELLANLQVILDRLVNWFVENSFYLAVANDDNGAGWNVPSTLSWVSTTAIPGQTLTAPNHEGLYEYLPSMTWPGTGTPDYDTFWNANGVPNPNLHSEITVWGQDLGVSASFAYLIIAYARAKQNLGKFETVMITGGTKTPKDALDLAQNLIDWMWTNYWDGIGICIDEVRADYNRLHDPVYVPTVFSGTMPNGDVIQNGGKFIDTRSFLRDDPKWPEVQAYINGTGDAPVFRYHRFWAQCEYATACGAMHHWFPTRTAGGTGVPAV